MPYDERLADRVRRALHGHGDFNERKMFGGLSFMVNGKMVCGVLNHDLVVRTGPDRFEQALAKPGVRPMDFTGRPMKGFVYVAPGGYSGARLAAWVQAGVEFAESSPAKLRSKAERT